MGLAVTSSLTGLLATRQSHGFKDAFVAESRFLVRLPVRGLTLRIFLFF
jgi:hypothetical protein